MIELRVLGTLAIQPPPGGGSGAAVLQPKRLALLLYLTLAEPPGPQSRESLMALLWPEADEESTRHSLRNALYGLRQVLGEGAIVSRGEGYVELDPAAIRCDAVEVRALLAAQRWKEALAASRGELAPGFHLSGAPEFERWLDQQREALRRSVADAGWRRVDEMERTGEPGIGDAARQAWAVDPTNEAGARRLMQVLDATAGSAAALRAYADLADYLRREYEAVPSAETRALAEQLRTRIQAAPPTLASDAAPSTAAAVSVAEVPVPAGSEPVPPTRRERPRRLLDRRAIVGMAILVAAAGSALALRSPRHSASSERPVARLCALQLPARYRADTSAYGSYLRGLSLRFQGHHSEALDTFAALVARAPQYAPGLAGLAHSFSLAVFAGLTPPSEGWPKAEQAARRAIALDSTTASAYLILGGVEMAWRWDLPAARKLIDEGIALDPSDAEAHIVRAAWYRWRGELDSALAEARTAHEMDPLNASFSERVARHLYFLRRYPEAEAMYRRNMRDYPGGSVNQGLAAVYRAEGRARDALDVMRSRAERRGDSVELARMPIATSDTEAARILIRMAGEDLRKLAEASRRGDPVLAGDWVFAYARAGNVGETLRWLDSMRVSRDPMLWSIPVDPSLDFIRSDPRYRAWEATLPWRHAATVHPQNE